MTTDPTRWLREAIVTRDLDRIPADMAAAGMRINDARATIRVVRTIPADAVSLAIAGCHDAARKAITAHMVARGLRPKKGDGAHKIVVEYARNVLVDVVNSVDMDQLDGLRRDRADAEYGDFVQRRFGPAHIAAAADLAQRVIDAVASNLAAPPKRDELKE